jgi:hypothetical protein
MDFTVGKSGCRLVAQTAGLCGQGGGMVDTGAGGPMGGRRGERAVKREFVVVRWRAE